MGHREKSLSAGASIVLCAVLVLVGLVRLLSYSQGAVGAAVCESPLGFLCYDPASRASAQFFKILATPSVVSAIYFFFRWRNAGKRSVSTARSAKLTHRLDFESPLLRGVLTTVITIHWIAMEWWKFNVEGFYPWSELESRWLNIALLLLGQIVAFWGMKYLSFEPVVRRGGRRDQ